MQQRMFIQFGSWTYHGGKIDLQPDDTPNGFDLSEYMDNGEFELTRAFYWFVLGLSIGIQALM